MVQRRKTKSHHLNCTLVRGLDCDIHVAQSADASDTMALASRHIRAMVRSVGRALGFYALAGPAPTPSLPLPVMPR